MSTVNQDELKAIKVLNFTGKESVWDHWTEKFVALARVIQFPPKMDENWLRNELLN